MDGNYRVLGIAPFEGMKSLMLAKIIRYSNPKIFVGA